MCRCIRGNVYIVEFMPILARIAMQAACRHYKLKSTQHCGVHVPVAPPRLEKYYAQLLLGGDSYPKADCRGGLFAAAASAQKVAAPKDVRRLCCPITVAGMSAASAPSVTSSTSARRKLT